MSYIIRNNKLQTAKPIKNLTAEQKKCLELARQSKSIRLNH